MDISVLTTIMIGVFLHFKRHMFEIRWKVGCGLIYLSVQMKMSFLFKAVLLLNIESRENLVIKSAIMTANSVENNH